MEHAPLIDLMEQLFLLGLPLIAQIGLTRMDSLLPMSIMVRKFKM